MSSTYPRKAADGTTVWACCVSSIGPVCQHRAVSRRLLEDELNHLIRLAEALRDNTIPVPHAALESMRESVERLQAWIPDDRS